MQITLEVPEDITQGFESRWQDLPRATSKASLLEHTGLVL